MQRIILALIVMAILAISVRIFVQKPQNFAAQPLPSANSASKEGEGDGRKMVAERSQAAQVSAAPIKQKSKPHQGDMPEAEFLRLFDETDFARSLPTALLIEKLEEQSPGLVATFIQNLLHSVGGKDLDERGRLIFLANELRTEELIPFWENVLERNPKALENEVQYFNAKETSLEAMALRNELSIAARNLGLLAFKNERALDVLLSYAKRQDADFDNSYARKDAYYAIREVNATAAARLLQSLPKDDALRLVLSHD